MVSSSGVVHVRTHASCAANARCAVIAAPVGALVFLLIEALMLCGSVAHAAERTSLVFVDPIATEARYSQALTFTAQLIRARDGSAVAGTACVPVCHLIVDVRTGNDAAQGFTLNAQGLPLRADGLVTIRIPFVDGAFDDARFVADDTGTPYRVRARFLGTGTGMIEGASCEDEAHPEGDLCGADAEVEVSLAPETARIVLGAGRTGALGTTVTLSAALSDENGNASTDGTAQDGDRAVSLRGRHVEFFYDQNNNGDPDAAERVGTAVTNDSGVASLDFLLDPTLVRAGRYAAGIHAQFGGDAQYGVARALGELVVLPGDIDINRTVIEADPLELPANGAAQSTVRVRLVDAFNNPFDEYSAPHAVEIAADVGRFSDDVTRDLENGTYTRTFVAPTIPGIATITTTIDGQPGPSLTLTLTGDSGGCQCGSAHDMPLALALSGLWLGVRRSARQTRARNKECP